MRTLLLLSILVAPAAAQPSTKPIVLKDGRGARAWTLTPRADGFKVRDAKQVGYRIKLDARRAKVRTAAKGVDVAYANTDGRKYKLKHPTTKVARFKLQPRPAGGFKLETAQDVIVARLNPDKQGGWVIKDEKRVVVARVVKHKTGWRVVDGAKRVLLQAPAKRLHALALACLALPKLSAAERLALLAIVDKRPPKAPKAPKPPPPASQPTSKPAR